MDPFTIIAIIVGVAITLFLIFVEDSFEKLFGWLLRGPFRLLGLQTGKGPLAAHASVQGDRLEITLENRGKHELKLAAVEGRDGNQKRQYPEPLLADQDSGAASGKAEAHKQFGKVALQPGESRTVALDAAELAAMDCRTLSVIDADGKYWPVEGFDPNAIG
jgi:hypothetical protein